MDARIQELVRRHEATPADVETARQLDAALRRAGRGDEVTERLLDKYLCRERWDTLPPVSEDLHPTVRRCSVCDADVVLCDGYEEAPTVQDQVVAGAGFAFTATSRQAREVLRVLTKSSHLHTAVETCTPRGHLSQGGGVGGAGVQERASALGHLFDPDQLWVEILDLEWHGMNRQQFRGEIARALSAFLPLARRLIPVGREPYLVLQTHVRRLLPKPPPTPVRHVLGWIGMAEGGAMFMARNGEPNLQPDEAGVGAILAQRTEELQREASLVNGRPVQVSLVATQAFLPSLRRLERFLNLAGVEPFLKCRPAVTPLRLPGTGPVTLDMVTNALAKHPCSSEGYVIALTERPDSEGWFARHRAGTAVIHIDRFARKHLATPNLLVAAHLTMKKLLDLTLEDPLPMHQRSRGCLFDLCPNKKDLDERIAAGTICAGCLRDLGARGVSAPVLEAVQRVLQAVQREAVGW